MFGQRGTKNFRPRKSPSHNEMTALVQRNVLRASATGDMEIVDDQQVSHQQLLFSAEVRKNLLRRRPYRPSSLRRQHNIDNTTNAHEQRDVEYTVLLSGSGLNTLDESKLRRTLRTKFPEIIRAQLWFEIPFREQESIKRKYNFGGPFVKIHFTSEVEREKAMKSTNSHYLGVKELRIHTYTPRRQASLAPPSSPGMSKATDISALGEGFSFNGYSSQLGSIRQQDANLDLGNITAAFERLQISDQSTSHQMTSMGLPTPLSGPPPI